MFFFLPYPCAGNKISYMASLNFSLALPANSALPPAVAPAGRDGFSMAVSNSLLAFFHREDVVFTVFRQGCWLLAQTPEIYAVSRGQPEFSLRRRLEEQLEVGKTVTNV